MNNTNTPYARYGHDIMLQRLKESLEGCPIVDLNGYDYFVHPLADGVPGIDPSLLDEVVDRMIEIGDLDCDRIVTSEAMGIPVGTLLSYKTGIPLTIVRKKRYGLPGETSLRQHTGYSKTDMFINGIGRGDRVVLVDDVVSTGGTLHAIAEALREVIGAEIVDILVIFDKSDRTSSPDIENGPRIKALMKVAIEEGRVVYQLPPS